VFWHSHSAGGGGWASHLQAIRVVRTFAMMALSTSTGASLNATRPISQSSTRRLPSITTGREAMSHRRSVLAYECQVRCQPKENQPQLVVEAEGILVSYSGCVCAGAACGRTRSHCLGQVEMSTNHQQCQTLHNYTGGALARQHGIGQQHMHRETRQLSHAAPQQNKST